MHVARRIHVALAALAVLVLSACSSTGKFPPAPTKVEGKDYSYIIGPGDSLNIVVWRNPELSMSVPVRPDGKIAAKKEAEEAAKKEAEEKEAAAKAAAERELTASRLGGEPPIPPGATQRFTAPPPAPQGPPPGGAPQGPPPGAAPQGPPPGGPGYDAPGGPPSQPLYPNPNPQHFGAPYEQQPPAGGYPTPPPAQGNYPAPGSYPGQFPPEGEYPQDPDGPGRHSR